MSQTMIPDFTKAPPRSGRSLLGRYAWLGRLADKVRADHAGTGADYVAYCGLSKEFLDAAGVAQGDFDRLIAEGATDDDLVRYFDEHVSDSQRKAANHLVLVDKADNLDQQDADEGRA
jgi:hypothetical protein